MSDPRLLTLLTLVKLKNYTKTAKHLFITQPSVTHHIKSIEKEYDIFLFESGKNFELTPQGRIMVEYARRMINQDCQLSNALERASLISKPLNLSFSPSAEIILRDSNLMPIILEFYSGNVHCNTASQAQIFEDLSLGTLDFAIMDCSFQDDYFEGIFLDELLIVPVCYAEGKFKEIKRITREMLKNNPIILGHSHEGLYAATAQALKKANISLSHCNLCYSNSLLLMESLIKEKDGIGFMYQNALPLFPQLKKMDLSNFSVSQSFHLVYNQNSFERLLLKELIQKIKKMRGSKS